MDKAEPIIRQQIWLVKTGKVWAEIVGQPDQALIDQSTEAEQQVKGLKMARFNLAKSLNEAQASGKSSLQLTTIQDKIDLIDKSIKINNEKIIVKSIYCNGQSFTLNDNDPNKLKLGKESSINEHQNRTLICMNVKKALIYGFAIIISALIISIAYLYSNRYSHVRGYLYFDKWTKEIKTFPRGE